MRLVWLIRRYLKKNGLFIILSCLVFQVFSIYWEAWTLNIPVWFVTRHRLFSKGNDDKEKYFTIHKAIESVELHNTIRVRLQMEYEEIIEASEFDFVSHFDKLQYQTASPLAIGNSSLDFTLQCLNLFKSYELAFYHPERVITNQGKVVIWETLFKDNPYEILSKEKLLGFMDFHSYMIEDLKLKHKLILKSLPKEEPAFYNGEGYVFLGGGIYTWLSLLSIQALRKTGSKLPAEIVIPYKKEYDKNICQNIFPTYNAKCILLPDLNLDIKGYQLKPLALIFSTFQNALYLDSDMIPTINPDRYFKSKLFADHGLITWPDFWRRTTSPSLYEALEIPIGDKPQRFLNDFYTPVDLQYSSFKEVNYHDLGGTMPEWSTEAGLLLLNKRTHFNVLLLALYYNLNGPRALYPLLSQGGAGEGDKDTWVLASHVLQKPWWQVHTKPRKLYGTWIKERNWIVDSSIVQVDLLDDYEGLMGLVWGQDVWRKETIESVGKQQFAYNYGYSFGDESWNYACVIGAALGHGSGGLGSDKNVWEPMGDHVSDVQCVKRPPDAFYHIHSPKLDPWAYIMDDKFTSMTGEQMRNFGEDEWLGLGWDVELWIWEQIQSNLCSAGPIQTSIKSLKVFANRDFNDVCGKNLENRIQWLKKDGEKKLEKSLKPVAGWKLADATRLKIEAEVVKCQNDNL